MSARIDLDRVEAPVPPSRRHRRLALALGVAGLAVSGLGLLLAMSMGGLGRVDADPVILGPEAWMADQRERAADPVPLRDALPGDAMTLSRFEGARGDALWTLATRDLPLDDVDLAHADDADFLERLDLVAGHAAWVAGPALPERWDREPNRGLLAERDAFLAGEPHDLVDAIHDVVDLEVQRALELNWRPAPSPEEQMRARVVMEQWDWVPRTEPLPEAPVAEVPRQQLALARAAVDRVLALLALAAGVLGAVLLWSGIPFLLRRRRVRCWAGGLEIDGETVDLAGVDHAVRSGRGVHVVFRSGERLEIPDLGFELARQVVSAIEKPVSTELPAEPAALKALRRGEGVAPGS